MAQSAQGPESMIEAIVRARADAGVAQQILDNPPEIQTRAGAMAAIAFVADREPRHDWIPILRRIYDFLCVRESAADLEREGLRRHAAGLALRADKAEREMREEANNNTRLRRENSQLKAELQSRGART